MNKFYLNLAIGTMVLFASCKKESGQENPQPETSTEFTVDPPLSSADADILEAAPSAPVDLKTVKLENGQSIQDFMQQKDPAFLNRFSRGANTTAFTPQEEPFVFIARMSTVANFLVRDDLHTYPAGADSVLQPSQRGLGYRYGSRSYTDCDIPPSKKTACRSIKFRGLDCSGMIYVMNKESGLGDVVPLPQFCVAAIADTAKWNSTFRRSSEFKNVIMVDEGKLSPSKMKTGDIILWAPNTEMAHIGMVIGGKIFQSNGRTTLPKCNDNVKQNNGPRALNLSAANFASFGGGEYRIFRPQLRSNPEELTGGSTRTWYGDTGSPNDGNYEYLTFKSDKTGQGGESSSSSALWTFNWTYANGVLRTYNMRYVPNVNSGAVIGDCQTPVRITAANLSTNSVAGNCSYYVRGTYVRSSQGM